MPAPVLEPRLVVADAQGNVYDHPVLRMVCQRGTQWGLPRPNEIMPLPPESELFLLPGRRAVGLNPESGQLEAQEEIAVAAFAAPAHTLTAHPACVRDANAPVLPFFAYGAVGFANGRFYICAHKVDTDPRQEFRGISRRALHARTRALMSQYPDNRLVQHIMGNCVLRYDCPAARNLALGRYEAPLPTSRACNARCVACISQQEPDSPVPHTPQCRLDFCPTPQEIVDIMRHHATQESRPIFSFGQGCEGEPLTEAPVIAEAIRIYRAGNGRGTVHCNSNASLPHAVEELARAGLTSLRVSLNSANETLYTRYYRPHGYTFADVRESMIRARRAGVFVSINLLYFPGVSDTEEEVAALTELVGSVGADMVQLRNLNIDPQMYLDIVSGVADMPIAPAMGPAMGLTHFRRRLRKACPWLTFGYYNPWLDDKATPRAPLPGLWHMPLPILHFKENEMNPEKDLHGTDDDNLDDDSFVTNEEVHGPSDDDFCGSDDVHDMVDDD